VPLPRSKDKTVPKLSHRQRLLLAAAAGRPDRRVLPAPETLRLKHAAPDRTLKALFGRGLIAELAVRRRVTARRGRAGWSSPRPVSPPSMARKAMLGRAPRSRSDRRNPQPQRSASHPTLSAGK